MAPLITFLAHRDRLTRDAIQKRLHDRLVKQAGCRNVRYVPSRIRRRYVYADVDPAMFLDAAYPIDDARLEIRFWKPARAAYEYYWINWIEPDRNLLVGWHQDDEHDALGNCHIQLDYRNETVVRKAARFIDAHPLAVFERRLEQVPEALDRIRWEDDEPTHISWPPTE